jgi:hypothetical protein
MERTLAYFVEWAQAHQNEPDQLLANADTILKILNWAVSAGKWADVLQLGRAIEGVLTLSGQWVAWEQVLCWLQQAGQILENPDAEAWALHQLGTRALCTGNIDQGQKWLSEALRLRETLGDHAGVAVTKHNLAILTGVLTPAQKKPPSPRPRPRIKSPSWFPALALIGGGIAAAVGFAIAIIAAGPYIPLPSPIAPATEPPTHTPRPTATDAPWVSVEINGDCNQQFTGSEVVIISVETNVGGPVKLSLDGQQSIGGIVVESEEKKTRKWDLSDVQPGEHKLGAKLTSPDGGIMAESVCVFTVASNCVDFEELPLNREYVEGDTFSSSGFQIRINDGTVRVGDEALAGGSGKELFLNNGYISFNFDPPITNLTLRYYQVSLATPFSEIVVNDIAWNGSLLDSADGTIINEVHVSAGDGILGLDGTIHAVIIGGSDLVIDDICVQ